MEIQIEIGALYVYYICTINQTKICNNNSYHSKSF